MNSLYRSFFFAGVLLLFCRIGMEVQTMIVQNIVWEESTGGAEPAGEEDSKESGNDDLTGHAEPMPFAGQTVSTVAHPELFDFSEHIQEIVPPPPLS